MLIESFRIKNYKSFIDSQKITLKPGFNIFNGQNNSGKTSILESLQVQNFSSKPHRDSKQPRSHPINPDSEIEIHFTVEGEELRTWMLQRNSTIKLPLPKSHFQSDLALEFLNSVVAKSRLTFRLKIKNGGWSCLDYPSVQPSEASGDQYGIFSILPTRTGFQFEGLSGGRGDDIWYAISQYGANFIYQFRAERLNIGVCPVASFGELGSNAENLPAVLLQLSSANPPKYNQYIAHVRAVLPTIQLVTSVPMSNNNCEIRIWQCEQAKMRDDIAFSLRECGTGVSQVLAILYVVVTATDPKIIIIDEPSSFLHPGAARKLIEILKGYKHQYIVGTHSTEIINVAEPSTLHLVSWADEQSKIGSFDRSSVEDVRDVLSEVGVKLSDFFGADHVLWVEGATEEACFPLVIREMNIDAPIGTLSIALRSTDELTANASSAEAVWEIYRKLTEAGALVPPTIGFSFDRENRSNERIRDLERASREQAHFLPRRTYENYLIVPEAIVALFQEANELEGIRPVVEVIQKWIVENGGSKKYMVKESIAVELEDPEWLKQVDAPRLLDDLLATLSDQKLRYRKTSHSVFLTRWLLKNKPEKLAELRDYLQGIFSPPKSIVT